MTKVLRVPKSQGKGYAPAKRGRLVKGNRRRLAKFADSDSDEETEGEGMGSRENQHFSKRHHTGKGFVADESKLDGSVDYRASKDAKRGSNSEQASTDDDAASEKFSILHDSDPGKHQAKRMKKTEAAVDPVQKLIDLAEADPLLLIIRLVIKERIDVLVLGEDDSYSMTLALAAIRGTFRGLWSSRIEATDFKPGRFEASLGANLASATSLFEHAGCTLCEYGVSAGSWRKTLTAELNHFGLLDWARFDLNFWAHQLGIACEMNVQVPTRCIWLNPPTGELVDKKHDYLRKTLLECHRLQEEGNVVFITLPNLAGSVEDCADVAAIQELSEKLGYRHWKEDTFVRDNCQHAGYYPQAETHNPELGWTTYIFLKVSPPILTMPSCMVEETTKGLPQTFPRSTSIVLVPAPNHLPHEPPSVLPRTPMKSTALLPSVQLPPSPVSPDIPSTKKTRWSLRSHDKAPNANSSSDGDEVEAVEGPSSARYPQTRSQTQAAISQRTPASKRRKMSRPDPDAFDASYAPTPTPEPEDYIMEGSAPSRKSPRKHPSSNPAYHIPTLAEFEEEDRAMEAGSLVSWTGSSRPVLRSQAKAATSLQESPVIEVRRVAKAHSRTRMTFEHSSDEGGADKTNVQTRTLNRKRVRVEQTGPENDVGSVPRSRRSKRGSMHASREEESELMDWEDEEPQRHPLVDDEARDDGIYCPRV